MNINCPINCPICLEPCDKSNISNTISCSKNHLVHRNCIDSWGKDECLLCMEKLKINRTETETNKIKENLKKREEENKINIENENRQTASRLQEEEDRQFALRIQNLTNYETFGLFNGYYINNIYNMYNNIFDNNLDGIDIDIPDIYTIHRNI